MFFFLIYRIISNILFLPITFYLIFRILKRKETWRSFKEKLGFYDIKRPPGKLIWINASSIGESLSTISLIKYIKKNFPEHLILMTTGTITSERVISKRAQKLLIHQFAPLDLGISVEKFLKHWKPDIAIFVESEIWPNLLNSTTNKSIKFILLNARISEKSFTKWKKVHLISSSIFKKINLCFAQDDESKLRFKELGVKSIFTYGNLKFSSDKLPVNVNEYEVFKKFLINKKVVTLSSSHPNEELMIIKIIKEIRKKISDIFLIIVPRHINRSNMIERLLIKEQLNFKIRSKSQQIDKQTNYYLADTYGELGLFYKLSSIVLIGGSFVKKGGQNPIEPSNFNCSVIFGPYMSNFQPTVNLFVKNKAAIQIKNLNELEKNILKILGDYNLKTSLSINLTKVCESEREDNKKLFKKINKIISNI